MLINEPRYNPTRYRIQAAHRGKDDWRDLTPDITYGSLEEAHRNLHYPANVDSADWLWTPGLQFRILAAPPDPRFTRSIPADNFLLNAAYYDEFRKLIEKERQRVG